MQLRFIGCSQHTYTLPESRFLISKSRFWATIHPWASRKCHSAAVTSKQGPSFTWWQSKFAIQLTAVTSNETPVSLDGGHNQWYSSLAWQWSSVAGPQSHLTAFTTSWILASCDSGHNQRDSSPAWHRSPAAGFLTGPHLDFPLPLLPLLTMHVSLISPFVQLLFFLYPVSMSLSFQIWSRHHQNGCPILKDGLHMPASLDAQLVIFLKMAASFIHE